MAEPEQGARERAKSKKASNIEPEPEPEPPPKKEEDVAVPATNTKQEEEDDEMEEEGDRVNHKIALAAVVTEKDLVHQENSLLSDHLMVLQNPPDVIRNPVSATEASFLLDIYLSIFRSINLSIYHPLSAIGSLLNSVWTFVDT